MSNINTNCNNAKVRDKHSAKKREVNQNGKKLYKEEFGSDFDIDATSAQANNFPEARGKTDTQQPVSERTAWH
ncbi:hypothetical protein ABHM93_03465 [Micromonospora provocatoris]|uniref:hypothetical protein n=1 Tax=Bacillati TaxID=1783272 RepID=UPI00116E53A9|nr:hypothetical protein [Lysinibacillus sp. CD3-6]QPQ33779.1 hypothetical protein JNUCC52_14070 [Lysinibacillus sp. JNUCC-52]UED80283.1 hypothetical protein FH508_0023515 [Lysinibacillus sp. CD3-6]